MRILSSATLSLALVGVLGACGSDSPLAGSDQSNETSTRRQAAISASPDATDLVATPTPSTAATAPTTGADTTTTPSATAVATTTSTAPTEASPLLRALPRDASEDPQERNAADQSGVLVVADGCLSIESELGITPIVWPFEATFDGTMVVTRIDHYTVGENISLGGGEVSDLASTVIPEQLDQAMACSESAASTPFHAQIG